MALVRAPYKIAPDYGEYQMTLVSGALTLVTANSPVWSCQWTSTTLICIVKAIYLHFSITTAYGAAQNTDYGLYFARSYSIADTGGTAATLTTNNGKLDTKYPTTSMADLRMATTAGFTAGTRTLDAQPISVFNFGAQAIGYTSEEYEPYGGADDRQQIILRQNEGLVLNNLVLMGATGVATLYVSMLWSEVPIADVR
jgi:hypothetical protein